MRISFASRLTKAVFVLAAAALWSSIATPAARADEFYDFSTGLGGLNVYDPFAAFGSSATITSPGADGTLRVQNNSFPAIPLPGGTARAGVYGSQVYTDFSASLDVVAWDASNAQYAALGARGSNVGLGTSDGYQASIQFIYGGTTALATIYRVDNEAITALTFQEFAIDTTHDYRISFEGVGSNLSVSIFDLSSAIPSIAVATASANDSTYSSGAIGAFAVGSEIFDDPVDITFDNLRATAAPSAAVPEPGTVGLLAMGLGVGAVITRRSRRSVLKATA